MERKKELYWADPQVRNRAIARAQAQHAFNRGDILWSPCPCGSKDSEMHHEDYSKPLEVKWLCRRCHMLEHYGPAPVVVERPKTSEDPIADLLRKLDARKAAAARAIIGPAKAGHSRARRVA
jgi:hypothetical protein